jgi:membrane-associated phospholipid phosphatase
MSNDLTSRFGRCLQNTGVALLTCAALTTICYLFVDRPVAYFVQRCQLNESVLLKELTYPPPIVQVWTPLILTAAALRRAWGPLGRWERVILAAGIGLIVADQFRESLRDVFGRYWPETWIDDNPSLIQDGAYGFHLFHTGNAYGSFPSGHAARTLAVLAAIWCAAPRWRWICAMAAIAEAIGLVGMNYHFVSDVIAGGFLGAIVGFYVAFFCGVMPEDGSAGRGM